MTDVIVNKDFSFDFRSGQMAGAGPPGGRKTFLDPAVAGEGVKVLLSDGRQVRPPPRSVKLNIPNLSEVEAVKHYFDRTDYHFFPLWLYHPTEPPVIARNADEAGREYGVELRAATDRERAEFGGGEYRWVFHGDWQTMPYEKPGAKASTAGKHLVLPEVNPTVSAVNELARALKADRGELPPGIDASAIDEFRQFLAWKEMQQAAADTVAATVDEAPAENGRKEPPNNRDPGNKGRKN